MKGKRKRKGFLSGLLGALTLITNVVSPMTVCASVGVNGGTTETNTLDEMDITSTSENDRISVFVDPTQEQWKEEDPGGDVDESGKAPDKEGEKPRDKLGTEDEENGEQESSDNLDTKEVDKVGETEDSGTELITYIKEQVEDILPDTENTTTPFDEEEQGKNAAVGDADGEDSFGTDLPQKIYHSRDVRAPDAEEVAEDFAVSEANLEQDGKIPLEDPELEVEYETINHPTQVEVTKEDATTGAKLAGAVLAVYVKEAVLDEEGNPVEVNGEIQWIQTEKVDENGDKVLDEQGNPIMVDKETLVEEAWTTGKDETHLIQYLKAGKQYRYILRELAAPYGYLKADDVEFDVQDTKEVQVIAIQGSTPTGGFAITRSGNFVNMCPWVDAVNAAVEEVIAYVKDPNTTHGVTFRVYADEDITYADGTGKLYYKKDYLVDSITTGMNGIATLDNLPLGRYRVEAVEAGTDQALEGQPQTIDLYYQGQEQSIITYEEKWQNTRLKARVRVKKVDEQLNVPIQGAEFEIHTVEEGNSSYSEEFIFTDSVIARGLTDENGELVFELDLPIGYSYMVEEVAQSFDDATSGATQSSTFDFSVQQDTEIAVYEVQEMVFTNTPTTVEVRVLERTSKKQLPKSTFQESSKQMSEYVEDKVKHIDEWVSETQPLVIRKLVPDKKHTSMAALAPNGYVKASELLLVRSNKKDASVRASPQMLVLKDEQVRNSTIM